jgi:hypothetical protein
VRADEKVGSGVARVTLSFDAWKGVRPAVVEVPVNPPAKWPK